MRHSKSIIHYSTSIVYFIHWLIYSLPNYNDPRQLPEFALTLDQMILPDDNEVDDSDNPLFDEENGEGEEEGGDLFYTPSSDPRLI